MNTFLLTWSRWHWSDLPQAIERTAKGEVLAAEQRTHGAFDDEFTPDAEGRSILRQHITYERSAKNRARALEIHGTTCAVCEFDFNEFYGADLARDFIEVHHTRSITEIDGGLVNPETDLVPLCSNCHSMVHRERLRIVPIEELRAVISKAKAAHV